jgi:protein ImuB
MRIACVVIPRFPLAVELLVRPRLRGQPVVVSSGQEAHNVVVECSAEAAREGVRRGMPLREVRAYCRDALFIDAHPALYRDYYERMLDALQEISPLVEEADPGCAYVGLDGLTGRLEPPRRGALHTTHAPAQRLFMGEDEIAGAIARAVAAAIALSPRVGIAESRFVAWAAALAARADEARVVNQSETASFLAALSVRYLSLSDDTARRFSWLGFRTMGDLVALPRASLAAQFGVDGERMWDLACGRDCEPLKARRQPSEIRAQIVFQQPVVEVQAVLAAARYLLTRLLDHPERAGSFARGLGISLTLSNGHRWERTLTFRAPTASHMRMLNALSTKLDGVAFPSAIVALTLVLHDLCSESGIQESLFTARSKQLHELRTALGQLRSRFGYIPVMRIVEVEPWSRIPERRYALSNYEP